MLWEWILSALGGILSRFIPTTYVLTFSNLFIQLFFYINITGGVLLFYLFLPSFSTSSIHPFIKANNCFIFCNLCLFRFSCIEIGKLQGTYVHVLCVMVLALYKTDT